MVLLVVIKLRWHSHYTEFCVVNNATQVAALFLACDDSAFMTTNDIMMDGGVTYVSEPKEWGNKQ